MATDGGEVRFSFTGDSTDLNKALEKAGKNLDGLVDSGQGAANKLNKDLSKATEKSKKGLKDFADTAGDADSSLMGIASGLDMINPALGDMARTAGDALAGIEGVGKAAFFANPTFLALAAVAAGVAAAYLVISENSARAEEAAKRLKVANDKLAISFATLHGQQVNVDNALLVANGHMTQQELLLANVAGTVREEYSTALHILNERLGFQLAKQREVNKVTGFGAAEAQNEASAAVRQTEKDLQGLERQTTKLIKSKQELINKTYENAEADKAGATATTNSADAKEKENEFLKLVEAARVASLSTSEKLEEAMKTELRLLDEAFQKEFQTTEIKQANADAKVLIETRYNEQIAALGEAEDQRAETMHQKELDRLARIRDENEKTALQVAADYEAMKSSVRSSLMELFDAFDAGFEALLGNEKLQEEHAEFLRVVFALQKAAALANIAIKTQEGLAVAAALPPPADMFKAAAVLATGAITAAIVASQPAPFHAGGIINAPDEVSIRAQSGEGVVNRTGMDRLGPAGLARINRGEGGGERIVVVQQFRHKIFDEFVSVNLKRSNSPLRRAIRQGVF